MKDKRELRASMKVELIYHEDKYIVNKRFPSTTEIEDFHFSPHKLLDEQERILTNEILVLMYNRMQGVSFEKAFGGGNFDFKVENPPGIDIEIHMKQPDLDLRKDLGEIVRELCKKHLKPASIQPSRYYISCKIDKCILSDENVQMFCTDFLNNIQTKMQTYSIIKKEKEIKFITPIKEINDTKQDWIQEELKSEDKSETVYKKCSFCSIVVEDIEKCEYCGGWFCRDHIKPKTPHDIEYPSTPGGHSCISFMKQKGDFSVKCSFCSDEKKDLSKCVYCGDYFCKNHLEPNNSSDSYSSKSTDGHVCRAFFKQENVKIAPDKTPKEKISSKHNTINEKKSFWKRLWSK